VLRSPDLRATSRISLPPLLTCLVTLRPCRLILCLAGVRQGDLSPSSFTAAPTTGINHVAAELQSTARHLLLPLRQRRRHRSSKPATTGSETIVIVAASRSFTLRRRWNKQLMFVGDDRHQRLHRSTSISATAARPFDATGISLRQPARQRR
jgi:hypothetical protein